MNSPSQTVHDARSGFHDITSLPDFHPSLINWHWLFGFLAICLIAYLIYLIFRRKKEMSAAAAVLASPYEVAQSRLEQLNFQWRERAIGERELASDLSLIVRSYIDQVWRFPADDRTAKEIATEFAAIVQQNLPALPAEIHGEVVKQLIKLLRFAEALTFSSLVLNQIKTDQQISLLFEQARVFLSDLHQKIEAKRAAETPAAKPGGQK